MIEITIMLYSIRLNIFNSYEIFEIKGENVKKAPKAGKNGKTYHNYLQKSIHPMKVIPK